MTYVLEYTLKTTKNLTKEDLEKLDDGARGMQSMIVAACKVAAPVMTPLVWFLTRFYRRTITKKSVSYNFYLIK